MRAYWAFPGFVKGYEYKNKYGEKEVLNVEAL